MKAVVVLDVGKTTSKLTLWGRGGDLLARETRRNARVDGPGYAALDVAGISDWLVATLARFESIAPIGAIIPVGHGAAAAIIRDDQISLPPMDYENPIPAGERREYDSERDSFEHTGSPALPDGLNLGAQLFHLESINPAALRSGTILLWPQYWAWFLSGVAASEVTSLGCHTDLWHPLEKGPSDLAIARGWADLLPPLHLAADVLGPIRPKIAERTGICADALVHCGLHDSNAALVAARAFPEIANREATVLSTGTWFVAMRALGADTMFDIGLLPQDRDCLVNVDAFGNLVPSSRFMGGREIEELTRNEIAGIDIETDQDELLAGVPATVASSAMALPSFAADVGPFPSARGRWTNQPQIDRERRAAVGLYAALVADVALELIGSSERILVEGRFAKAEVLVRALATLRPDTNVYVADAENDVSFGALCLLEPTLQPASSLRLVQPLDCDLSNYRSTWRELAAKQMQSQ